MNQKNLIRGSVAIVAAAGSVLLFQNVSSTTADPCANSQLCRQIHKAMTTAPTEDGRVLTNGERVDLAANVFGYGVGSAATSLMPSTADDYHVRRVARLLALSLERPRLLLKTAAEMKLASGYDRVTPNFRVPFNGVKDGPEKLFLLARQIYMNTVKAIEDHKAGKITAAQLNDIKDAVKRDRTFIKSQTRFDVASFRAMQAVTGSQALNEEGKLVEMQVDLNGVLGEFWFNHFNVDLSKSTAHVAIGPDGYENRIRGRMFGTFADLLRAVITHPAMLHYLDNQANVYNLNSRMPSNQNLGRELLELHTMGEGPGRHYSQEDVEASAALLTGLNIVENRDYENNLKNFYYRTMFLPANHVPDHIDGQLTSPKVMGMRFCLEGQNSKVNCPIVDPKLPMAQKVSMMRKQLDRYFEFLASRPRVRRNICTKLVRQFVANDYEVLQEDDPLTVADETRRREIARRAVIERCEAAWGTNGNLTAMYRAILTSPQVWASDNYRRMVKNPLELTASAMRAYGYNIRTFRGVDGAEKFARVSKAMVNQIKYLGLPYHEWGTPTGYPQAGNVWISQGYLVRWTATSFKLANLLEADKSGTLPISGLKVGMGMSGSFESAMSKIQTPNERYEFMNQMLRLGSVRVDSGRYRTLLNRVLTPGSLDEQIDQNVEGSWRNMPLKSALVLKMSNSNFLRR